MRAPRAVLWTFGAGLASVVVLVLCGPEQEGGLLSTAPVRGKINGFVASRSLSTARAISPRVPELPWREIESALPLIWLEQDPLRREQLLVAALQRVAPSEIPLVLIKLQAAPEREIGLDLSAQLVRRWAEQYPQLAAAWAEQLPAGRNRQNSLEQVALAWARLDTAAAADWAGGLPADEEWQQTLSTILSETVRVAPRETLGMACELPGNFVRDEIIVRAVAEWAVGAPTDAVTWALQIEDTLLREQALSAIAIASGDRDPRAAARLALGTLPPGRLQDNAVMGIVQRWAQSAPFEAAGWVERFPSGELKSTAIENLAMIWADHDSTQVLQWLDQLTPAVVVAAPAMLTIPFPN